MGKADLHAHTCHTAWGDGNQTVEQLLDYVETQTDLDIFAITDHDDPEAARVAWQMHQNRHYRFDFLPGVEVTNLGGHLLCYFPGGDIPDIPSLRPFWWTVRYVKERGGVCVVAHAVYPPWLAPTIQRGLEHDLHVDGVEAVNAGISEQAQTKLKGIAARFDSRVALVGNSDAHHQIAIGTAYTIFPGRSTADFLQALRNRETEPVFVQRPRIDAAARRFTTRRSMTHPGWVGNVWREFRR